MLETLLRLEGCKVEVAGTGPHGLEMILKSKPDLALVDIGLPLMSGYEVAERVRKFAQRWRDSTHRLDRLWQDRGPAKSRRRRF